MEKSALAALAVALLSSGAAYGADVYNPGSTKDGGGFSGPVAVNWTGLYIGGSVGYGNANHELSLHDVWKDYCDKAKYNWTKTTAAGIDTWTPSLKTGDDQIDVSDPAKDPNRFFNHSEADLEGCVPPSAVAGTIAAPSPNKPGSYKAQGIEPGGSREVGSLDGLNTSGLVGDGRIGFDVARGRFLFGVFGSYGFSNMEADGGLEDLGSFTLEKGDEWSVGARAGILVNPRTLAYIMAAYTQTDYELTLHGSGEDATSKARETTFDGVTVGGGVEFALTGNVFLGVEGTHTFYGKETIFSESDAESNIGARLDDELGETKVMGTLKIKLNTGLGGVID